MKKLRELTVEELFESFVLIKNADVRVAKNGKKVYCLYLSRHIWHD